jgi:bifunctional non-homologous end joining protein LigD
MEHVLQYGSMARSDGNKRAPALKRYREKRSFRATPEPAGKRAWKSGHSFVIQEHHARRHHFDFRLEMDGVLVSWAVPKGIPEDPAAKRLAVHVEDHPLEYGSFEGEIPRGNYGAGTVKIWDKGEWIPQTRTWRQDFAKGKLKFYVRGERLHGEYLLVRSGDEPNWLLRKLSDEAPPLEAHELEREQPAFIPFQLAKVVPAVPSGSEWIHEIKLDGYRIQVIQAGGKITIYTRNGHDWTDKFEALAKSLRKLSNKDFILDGEAVVFDEKGRTSFGLLQEAVGVRARKRSGIDIGFVAFDLLHYDGFNLRPLPLSERLKWLDKLPLSDTGPLRRSKYWPSDSGADLFREACRLDLEGIISKKLTQSYAPDLREWTKSKCRPRQEFIVCGYLPPKSSLPAFSSLVLGTVENGKLVPRGKVGTGFSDQKRREVLAILERIKTTEPAFKIEDRGVIWVRPQLVAEVEYAEITRDGSVRQASFIALREDKGAKEVHLEGIQRARADAKGAKVAGIAISNPGRVVFPEDGITKFQVAEYFERVADLMLPFVANRPLALLRAPTGVGGELFFQKSFDKGQPPNVYGKTLADGTETIFVKDAKGLVSLAQFGVLELHPWGARYPQADKPDFLIWDLDPDAEVSWSEVKGAALLLRDFLRVRGLETMIKTSGGKGLHIQLPVRPTYGWDVLKEFTRQVSIAVAAFNPPKFTTVISKSRRKGKIFIDYLRNGRGATCIAPWGLRARPKAPVSMPVTWEDLASVTPAGFTIEEPSESPEEWTSFTPQRITKAHLKEFGL